MAPGIEISPDELKVFVQEVESLLDVLDEDIIRLESEADNQELLQEIFRAAHTLKGSSGMVGFTAMQNLTHKMEDLLDRVRKGTLAVTPQIVDALLMSLDGLKVLRGDLASGAAESSLDVTPIIAALGAAAEGNAPTAIAPALGLDATILASPALQSAIEAARAAGLPLWRVAVALDPETEWNSVRLFQSVNELRGRGEVIASMPSMHEIEEEHAGHTLEALLASKDESGTIVEALQRIDDVVAAAIEEWKLQDGATSSASAASSAAAAPSEGVSQAAGGPKIESLSQTVRIDVDKLDALINLVGELVIDRTRVAQVSKALMGRYKEDEQVRILGETSTHLAKVIDVLHENMMQARMLPVGVLFSKFPRLVRDLARAMDKQITLTVEGEDTEIDRTVIEEIKDPIIHLIRNSVDHGIEDLEERRAAGKPEKATVHLAAQHGPGYILITVSDDGRGIDPAKIRQAAVSKGVITAEAGQRISDQEAIELIFEPGLTTATKATEVSGRGVGMDIVRSRIESLNGSVEVESTIGTGTVFKLRLPLTLATVRGLLVSARGGTFAIPLAYVREIVRPDATLQQRVIGRTAIQLRDMAMGMFSLADLLSEAGIPAGESRPDGDNYVVVVRAGESDADRPVALTVDELVDQQEIVVKSLSGYLGRARGIAGATILGDGEVALILDVPALIKGALAPSVAGKEAERNAA